MSDTNNTIAVNLQLNTVDNNWSPGYATVKVAITNSDGTAPTVPTINGVAVCSVAANTGSDAAQYPYIVTFTAANVGTGTTSLFADNVAYTVFNVTVTQLPPETANADPTTLVVVPPAPQS